MKLYFDNFKQIYHEFTVLSELTTKILASMGIILRPLQASAGRAGVLTTHFSEFGEEDEEEQQMDEEGVYSSHNVLTMQVGIDETILTSPHGTISPSPHFKDQPLSDASASQKRRKGEVPFESQGGATMGTRIKAEAAVNMNLAYDTVNKGKKTQQPLLESDDIDPLSLTTQPPQGKSVHMFSSPLEKLTAVDVFNRSGQEHNNYDDNRTSKRPHAYGGKVDE